MPHVAIWRNGVKMVSATELPKIIAKPFLEKWRKKLCQCKQHAQAEKSPFKPAEKAALEKMGLGYCGTVYADLVKDDAADLGNEVHELVEQWFSGIGVFPNNNAGAWATKITQVYAYHNVKPVIIKPEEVLIDEDSNLNGSPDTVGEWDGRIEILDTKIKNSLDELTAMQGCAYRYLLRRKKGVDVRYMRPIWCQKESKDKAVSTVLVYDLDEWYPEWKALVMLWNKLNPKRKVVVHD